MKNKHRGNQRREKQKKDREKEHKRSREEKEKKTSMRQKVREVTGGNFCVVFFLILVTRGQQLLRCIFISHSKHIPNRQKNKNRHVIYTLRKINKNRITPVKAHCDLWSLA